MAYPTIQQGDIINITAAGAITAGQIWAGTEVGGVYLNSGTTGAVLPVAVEGVYTLPKKAGTNLDAAVGEVVYALSTGGVYLAVATSASTIRLGYAVEAAATTATTIKVKLC